MKDNVDLKNKKIVFAFLSSFLLLLNELRNGTQEKIQTLLLFFFNGTMKEQRKKKHFSLSFYVKGGGGRGGCY
jgi:hypothetical protein